MKKKIVFYTQVYYLDAALEYIQQVNPYYDLSVFIELTPHSSQSNIFNLDIDLTQYDYLIPIQNVAHEWGIPYIIQYLDNTNLAYFVNHKTNKSISFDSFKKAFSLCFVLDKINPDFVHLDDISLRQIGMLPWFFVRRDRIILNVHDPKPHSGETDLKKRIFSKILYGIVSRFLCMSEYSASVLFELLPKQKRIFNIKFLPYTVYKNFEKVPKLSNKNCITFVGRLSLYKGINLFIEAYKRLQKTHHGKFSFVIAGKSVNTFNLSSMLPNEHVSLDIIDRHLSNEEIVGIVQNSSVIVCPYLDATQSGVLMTAFALGKPVIVSPVGGLPEYVNSNVNGSVMASLTSEALESAIVEFFEKKHEKTQTIDAEYWDTVKASNLSVIQSLYI